ncbi:redoxin domain-containing protein [Lacticaseibacillus zhaodongensis]|uniref:redoxin domain-containing protein n=1 Tax=Lacticaseibacillus zhaodongensis TaxID=2668065 RepID=UPI0012D2D1B4|nr:redoxin domain-containing protein [Lacticaseibacillus zhaodongensis]
MQIERHGIPVELSGDPCPCGAKLPLCNLYDASGKRVPTSSLHGWSMFSILPVFAKQVCDQAILAFHQVMARFSKVKLYTVAITAPAELNNWCGWIGSRAMTMLADPDAEFGLAMGLYIPCSHTLARSLYIVDPQRVVRYRQVVREQSEQTDFGAAVTSLQELVAAEAAGQSAPAEPE